MKHLKQFLLAVLVALTSCVTANAYDFEVDGIYYNITSTSDFTCAVTYANKASDYHYYSPYSGDIVIPSTVESKNRTLTVTSIGDNAFYECKNLTSLEIPNSVTTICFYHNPCIYC